MLYRRAAKQYMSPPDESQCPIEDGVVWTPWGSISASALIAGIATGLQPQEVTLTLNIGHFLKFWENDLLIIYIFLYIYYIYTAIITYYVIM
jgi:hypothetical protein